MDGFKLRMMRLQSGRFASPRSLVAALAVIAFFQGTPSEASPIRNRSLHVKEVHASTVSSGLNWQEYLNGGVSMWSAAKPPRIPSGIRLASVNGRLVETQFVDYLLWRRSLDPIRFDAHHPNISGPLAQILVPPATPIEPPASIPPQGQVVVPEPKPLWMAIIFSGIGFVLVHRLKRRKTVAA